MEGKQGYIEREREQSGLMDVQRESGRRMRRGGRKSNPERSL